MRVKLAYFVALLIAFLVGLTSMPNLAAQEKAKKAPQANVQGLVQNMSKDTSTITVLVGKGTNVSRQVVYDSKTKFVYGHSDNNKPGALAQVKESYYISCGGTFNAKNQLMATLCIYRETP